AAGVDAKGHLEAGIEIALAPGWKTYWRSPGYAGIAPRADFSASANIGPVEIAYPVPERDNDGFVAVNVYRDRVVLPLSAPLVDPSRPASLAVTLDIGICDEICVPARFDLAVDVPDAADKTAAAILAQAEASL